MTAEEIDALQATNLDRATPFVICGVSRGQLSIARFYGGCKFQGRNYSYIPTTDELLRDDVVKWLAKHRKAQQKVSGCGTETQGDLLTANVEVQGRLTAALSPAGVPLERRVMALTLTEDDVNKQEKLKKCRTVGQLIAELEKLPKTAKLSDPLRPVYYNTGETAKQMGLTPQVGFEDYG